MTCERTPGFENAARAGLVVNPWEYRWSSATARVPGREDPLLTLEPLQAMVDDWAAFLAVELPDDDLARFRRHARTDRPLGSPAFLQRLEAEIGQVLLPQKRGPKAGKKGEDV